MGDVRHSAAVGGSADLHGPDVGFRGRSGRDTELAKPTLMTPRRCCPSSSYPLSKYGAVSRAPRATMEQLVRRCAGEEDLQLRGGLRKEIPIDREYRQLIICILGILIGGALLLGAFLVALDYYFWHDWDRTGLPRTLPKSLFNEFERAHQVSPQASVNVRRIGSATRHINRAVLINSKRSDSPGAQCETRPNNPNVWAIVSSAHNCRTFFPPAADLGTTA
jgi:hypothetical protein